MLIPHRLSVIAWFSAVSIIAGTASAQDWPQWRGANRDGRAGGFNAPANWPKELTQKWKTAVGDGVATPALVGDKVFVFSRQDGNEVTRCLDAASGKEVWSEQYPALGVNGPASGFSGPRASPAVADGKVVTLGIHGVLSCLDAATGKKIWRKDDFPGEVPRFYTSSSPILVDGMCIAQLGGQRDGGIVAYDLATGAQKWKWIGDGPSYASPALMSVDGAKLIIAETDQKIVAVSAADGKLAWETSFAAQGMGAYNAATPIVDGQTLIYSGGGRGTHAVKLEKTSAGFAARELWSNAEKAVQFTSPVVKEGFIYGMTQSNELFCLNEQTGQAAWTAPLGSPAQAGPGPGGPGPGNRPNGRPGRRGGGRGGYGTIVDAGSVLLALTPKSELVVFQSNGKAYTELARIKVADSATYAYPVLSGNRVFIKDQQSVTLLTID